MYEIKNVTRHSRFCMLLLLKKKPCLLFDELEMQ